MTILNGNRAPSLDTRLNFSSSTSRGADTYGYPIAKLTDTNTGQTYRCCGGGYDMNGTNLGHWLQETIKGNPLLLKVFAKELAKYVVANKEKPYGLNFSRGFFNQVAFNSKTEKYSATKIEKAILGEYPDVTWHLDGACGDNCMVRIAELVGMTIRTEYQRGRSMRYDKFLGYVVRAEANSPYLKFCKKNGYVV